MKVVIVGAGLGGLSAACHLGGMGHEVVVVEANDFPGGRAGAIDRLGYHLDNGPTVLTMVNLIRDAVTATGSRLEDLLELVPVEPGYRAFYSDGHTFDGDGALSVFSSAAAMVEEISSVCGASEAGRYLAFRDHLQRLYEAEFATFIDANVDRVSDLGRSWRQMLALVRLGGFGRLDALVRKYFRDERLIRLFSFQALYAGLSPLEALGIYGVITYMDAVEGVWFPKGGMSQVPKALEVAAVKCGVSFLYGQRVEELVLSGGEDEVRGVRCASGELIVGDAVIVTTELAHASKQLPDSKALSSRLGAVEYSPSALLLLLGVKDAPSPRPAHHSIYFGAEWSRSFRELLKDGTMMSDPSILVSSPSTSDSTLAPEGGSVFYVLEPVPNLSGRVNWEEEADRSVARLKTKLSEFGLLDLSSVIEVEERITPLDWLDRGMALGTPFAISHRFFQSGPFRPSNTHPKLKNLFFAGSSTLPGVGVPMVLISGKLAAQRVGPK